MIGGRVCSPFARVASELGVAHINDEHLQTLIVSVMLIIRTLVALLRIALEIIMPGVPPRRRP